MRYWTRGLEAVGNVTDFLDSIASITVVVTFIMRTYVHMPCVSVVQVFHRVAS